ncbi:MAG: FecR domain-containing protein [Polaromonas sp.]|uniref:FecR family protein n=1 Tax=Polaromonas sp. TaxID=1869339 RepID=UPI0025F75AEE|nr:FecR family protein [Polaromonas sp.]MBI2727761.1 FecR domain-containing protein [Polaromonas sp.]
MNKGKKSTIAGAILILCSGMPAWAVPAGKVLAIAGSATLERAGQQIPLQNGALVESGDTLTVGDKSMLQVRFTDESVVALRANSQFKIENYRFEGQAGSDQSLMGLLKGGMRTITGLIGKANQSNYAVRTATSTIGIRGTHFSVVSCNNDCARPDGTMESNGTFGGVTDGRITVSNSAGSQEFSQQDSFHVPSASSPPIRLLAPPAILNDRMAAARGRSTAAAGSSGEDAASSGSSTSSGARVSTSPQLVQQSSPSVNLIAPLTTVASSDLPATVINTKSSSLITVLDFEGFYSPTGTDQTKISFKNFSPADIRAEAREVSNSFFTNAQTLAAAFAPVRTVGSSAAAGAYWMYEAPNAGSVNSVGSHHIWGDSPTIALPASGIAQYNYVGGTAPTDNYGRVGTFTGSNLMVNYGTGKIQNVTAMTMSFGTNAQQATATTYSVAASNTWSIGGGNSNLANVSCTGCTGTTAASINGKFVGENMQGYAAAIKVTNTQLNTSKPNAAGTVAAFARQ